MAALQSGFLAQMVTIPPNPDALIPQAVSILILDMQQVS